MKKSHNSMGMGWTTDKEKIATALTITIFEKTSTSHRVGLPRTCKRRSTTTKPRLVYTKRDVLSGANINNFADKTKLFELINNFNIDDAKTFINAIGKCFPQQEEKEHRLKASFDSKYQILDFSEFGVKILLRVSDHNINAFNIKDDVDEAYSIVFKQRKSGNTFVNRDDIIVREYVYWEENCNRERYLKIAQNIYKFLETSEWDEDYVKADATNPPATKGLGETNEPKYKVGDVVFNFFSNKELEVIEVVKNRWGNELTYTYKLSNGTVTTGENLKLVKKADNTSLFQFAQHLSSQFDNGESYDWTKVQRLAKELGVNSNPQELMQACELAVVLSARRIAQNSEWSEGQCFEQMKRLYQLQPIISTNSSESLRLQQYSTPCPISYLAGLYVSRGNGQLYYEPTAGNGMLTVALPPDRTIVNELDPVRVANLKMNGFADVLNDDAVRLADSPLAQRKYNVIMNPPFGSLKPSEYLYRDGKVADNEATYTFKRLDHKIAVLTLEKFLADDNARAAIIVGGKLAAKYNKADDEAYWNKQGRLQGAFGDFISYLNRAYLIDDIFYLDGKLYGKQGTQFPIVMILVRGRRKQWDGDPLCKWRTYDSIRDKQVQSFDELLIRMRPYLAHTDHEALVQRLNAKLVRLEKMKIETGAETKMYRNCKHLTAEDVAALMSGHAEADIQQIDDVADIATYKIAPIPYGSDYELEQFEQITLNRAIELVGRKEVIFGLARLAFHGWSGPVTRGNGKYTLRLSAPKSYWAGGGVDGTENYAETIKNWLNPADISYAERLIDAEEKERLKILERKFGKKLEPIAVVPYRFVPIIGKDIDDSNVYCSKAYFLNHYLHHIGSTSVLDYQSMQSVLIDPEYIVETIIDGNSSYVFVRRDARYNCYVISFEKEGGKLILHKTYFTQLKKPYKNVARLFEVLPEDATFPKEVPSIVHTVRQYTPSDDFMG